MKHFTKREQHVTQTTNSFQISGDSRNDIEFFYIKNCHCPSVKIQIHKETSLTAEKNVSIEFHENKN